MTPPEPWQTSWEAFAREVQRLYHSKAAESEFIKRFNGKRVFWEGQVLKVHVGKELNEVTLRMPEYRITLPDGRVALMEYVSSPPTLTSPFTCLKRAVFGQR